MNAIWQVCAAQLEQEIPAQQYRTWIKPLHVVGFDEAQRTLRMGVSNRVKLDWVSRTYGARIQQLASAIDPAVRVQFELAASIRSQAQALVRAAATTTTDDDADSTQVGTAIESDADASPSLAAELAAAPATEDGARHVERTRLNPDLTFTTLVKGKGNQIALAAALQVSERPGVSYNPLFLYGGVGLGKTHLCQAVGHAVLARKPRARIRYIHAEQFVSDVVRAYQRKAFDDFKRYYHSLDLLLIDDIQFFSGREGTQEQFFYAFEALTGARKQIILTSDTYPREMTGFQDRLKSRFDAGLIVQIEPPELEMRVAILMRKAEQHGRTLPQPVAFYLAEQLRANVRELEGALKKVLAHAEYYDRPITMELVKDAVKDMLSFRRGQVSIEQIQKVVADYYKIKVADMHSHRKFKTIAMPRQIAMYLAKELTQKSLPEIGESFGGRDHTTVLHAVRKINDARKLNTELNHALHLLEQTLNG